MAGKLAGRSGPSAMAGKLAGRSGLASCGQDIYQERGFPSVFLLGLAAFVDALGNVRSPQSSQSDPKVIPKYELVQTGIRLNGNETGIRLNWNQYELDPV